MTLIYNGVDMSAMVTKYGFFETPRVIMGPNENVARDGSLIDDTRAVKFDPTFTLLPVKQEDVDTVWALASLKGFHTLQYKSATGAMKSILARMRVTGKAQLALASADRTIYTGIVVVFEVK